MNLITPSDSTKPPTRELTDIQQTVVDALVLDSSLSPIQLAEKAGCTENYVWKILQKQHVKEYLLGQVNARLLLSAIPAMECKSQLLQSNSDYIRDKASSDILDRNQVGVQTTTTVGAVVTVNIDLS